MCLRAGPTVVMVGTVGMWCLCAMRRGGIWGRYGVVSTFGPGGGGMARGRIGMGPRERIG